jgi:4-amino-4-deoxy-L-arabinose transferase-like glycosyltransferase
MDVIKDGKVGARMAEASDSRLQGAPWGRLLRAKLTVFLLLGILTLIIRAPDLGMPLERDEGEYAYAAQEIARGFMPYKDSFCQKPPLIFFWYLGAFHLFGENTVGIHLMLAAAAWLASFGLFLLGRRLVGGGWGFLCSIIFGLTSASYSYFGSAANTEVFMLVPVIYAAVALLEAAARGGRTFWFVSGVLGALAVITKQVAVFSMIGPAVFALMVLRDVKRPLSSFIRAVLWGGVGGGATIIAILMWLNSGDALGAFLNVAVGHNLEYVAHPLGLWKWKRLWAVFQDRFLLTDGLLWASAGATVLLGLSHPFCRVTTPERFGAFWLMFSLPGILLGPYVFGHYFLQMLPPLALSAVALCRRLVADGKAGGVRRIMGGALASALVLIPAGNRMASVGGSADSRCEAVYSVYGPVPFVGAASVGRYLKSVTRPIDRVLIVGSEPEVLFYAERRSATRYTIVYPLTGTFSAADAMRREFFEDWERNDPQAVVVCHAPSSFIAGRRGSRNASPLFLEACALLEKGYRYAGSVGGGAEIHGMDVIPMSGHASGRIFDVFVRASPGEPGGTASERTGAGRKKRAPTSRSP